MLEEFSLWLPQNLKTVGVAWSLERSRVQVILSDGVQNCPMSQPRGRTLVSGAASHDGALGSGHTARVPQILRGVATCHSFGSSLLLPWFLRVPGLTSSVGWMWNAADLGLRAASSVRNTEKLFRGPVSSLSNGKSAAHV